MIAGSVACPLLSALALMLTGEGRTQNSSRKWRDRDFYINNSPARVLPNHLNIVKYAHIVPTQSDEWNRKHKIFIHNVLANTNSHRNCVCSGIPSWNGCSIFPSREGEIQLKDLEKILLGELCLLWLQLQRSPASYCFPLGSVCRSVRLLLRDCEVRGRVIKSTSQDLQLWTNTTVLK